MAGLGLGGGGGGGGRGGTRLDGLVGLLDTGTNASVRRMAAGQIGDLVAAHPAEVRPVLARVRRLLLSPSWDTRVAAGHALAAIAAHAPRFVPSTTTTTTTTNVDGAVKDEPVIVVGAGVDHSNSDEMQEQDEEEEEEEEVESDAGRARCKQEEDQEEQHPWGSLLRFSRLDLIAILESGALLFGSSGDAYQSVTADVKEQRARLKADLGLDDRVTGGSDMLDIADTDFIAQPAPAPDALTAEQPAAPPQADHVVDNLAPPVSSSGNISARERNRMKREAKKRARLSGMQDVATVKKPRLGGADEEAPGSQSHGTWKQDECDDLFDSSYSDFQPTCEMLKKALLDSRWEARHGAAVGLRHVLAVHAWSMGRHSPIAQVADRENSLWLEDLCCRLLCVLAMDRFGDFVGEAVVAPVRETAAMTMATACRSMDHTQAVALLKQLLSILDAKQAHMHWELRHAVLIGIRYILAVLADSKDGDHLTQIAFPKIAEGLSDSDDDVRAVAAEALLPIAYPVSILLPDRIPSLVAVLWDALLDLDDISASTGSVLRLLTKFSGLPVPASMPRFWISSSAFDDATDPDMEESHPASDAGLADQELPSGQVPAFASQPLVHLLPRVWPFLRHGAVSVRTAVISLIECLLNGYKGDERELVYWLRPLCGELFGHLFRNILLETNDSVLQCTKRVWTLSLSLVKGSRDDVLLVVESTSHLLAHWLSAASHESRADAAAFDHSQRKGMGRASQRRRSAAAARRAARAKKSTMRAANIGVLFGVDGHDTAGPAVEGPYEGVAMQISAAQALGGLAAIWPSEDPRFVDNLLRTLQSPFAIARRLACDICRCWGAQMHVPAPFDERLRNSLVHEMEGTGGCPYGEVGMISGGFFGDTLSFLDVVGSFLAGSMDVASIVMACEQGKAAFSRQDYAQAALSARALHPHVSAAVVGALFVSWEQRAKSGSFSKRQIDLVSALRHRILTSLGYITVRMEGAAISLSASASSALVENLGEVLPAKIGPFVKALTASLRTSENPHLQQVAATALATFSSRLCSRNTAKPLALLLKNLTKYLTAKRAQGTDEEIAQLTDGNAKGAGNRKMLKSEFADVHEQVDMASSAALSSEPADIARRGAVMAFQAFCEEFSDQLFERLPSLWSSISNGLENLALSSTPEASVGPLADSMTLVRTIVDKLPRSLHERVAGLLPAIVECCAHGSSDIRDIAAMTLADVVSAIPGRGIQEVVHHMIPMLNRCSRTNECDRLARRGAAKALRAVVNRLGHVLIPYAAFLIVPIMMRMVDPDSEVRDAAAGIFGVLVRIMPLEGGAPDDPDMSASMAAERQEARAFLGQLLGTHPREHYAMPVPIEGGIHLRKYQQDCLDWLYFLNRYGLHGALCDDMGLGKTLMTLCIIAGDRYAMETSRKIDSSVSTDAVLPSIVVCPGTIAAHWVQECQRFFATSLGNVCLYAGSPKMRARLRSEIPFESAALVVTSYEVLSNDLQYFTSLRWNYVALDEGHVIKNPKTRVARAVRALFCRHRLVLTGTPIQNSVLELWSLFDFLMPGFLGTEQSFKETYAKPILASRGPDCSESDREKGLVATEALHRQVLPFVLRRLKDDVLSELPPKIMQDYYCNMTPLQVELYQDFSEEITQGGIDSVRGLDVDTESRHSDRPAASTSANHIFKVLSYLRRLCSHPKLVLTESHPEYGCVLSRLKARGQCLDDLSSSSKLVGLQNILKECGIGDPSSQGRDSGGHRVLIFAQLKQMLDLVESDLFMPHMPDVTYLRLDGSVEVSKRQSIVTRFNADPTIDVLLLTTSVGGLGLNLVGADTVIFLEHDWNPTKDLQAMDRAHRMGQKRTVNVYRLITKGTLEEKIMGMQKFKTHIANTVVNRENSSLQSMNTETLLSLFQVDDGAASNEEQRNRGGSSNSKGLKAALSGLGDLWEESQYEEEYNIDSFLAGMNRDEHGNSS